MSSNFQWAENTVAEFIQTKLHIQQSASFDLIEQFKASKKPKPVLFTTEDGVGIAIGERYWYVTKDLKLYLEVCDSHAGGKVVAHERLGDKYFSTKEAAEAYCLYNRPLITLNEIIEIGNSEESNPYFKKLVQKAKEKLNHPLPINK